MAESITEGTLKQWVKQVGDFVKQDEEVATIETDKIDVPVNAPTSGIIKEVFAQEEDTVAVGADLFRLEETDQAPEGSQEAAAPKEESHSAPAAEESEVKASPAPTAAPPKPATPAPAAPTKPSPAPATSSPSSTSSTPETPASLRGERLVKMTRMRLRIAERLKESQNAAASLTTFNEIDMTNLMNLRKEYKDLVLKKHGIKLGFMSAFVKASAYALQEVPEVNACIDASGDYIKYHDYADISVAVATPKGLVTPVLRNAEQLSFVGVERAIANLGARARDNKLTIEDMTGGTFTISNGGVFGSLYGTPIINLPQSAILGMHAIKERPVAVNGKIEIRPMMYVALTYDHRLIDGREAVTFLVKVKEAVEDPRRLLLEV
ncbi:dihydrolipoyllysine-residue succinyltransferase E2 component [Dimargaris cristalligena]|uniref:dihydrolipoyllysine-residue succinyltransferase n=1 Tax=Dimargaris cristalligena TaxID=215637 RepID=A0A4V1J4L5_9FUNG|nr:dihydrolipoyllysine-residue succinyltransferase E2 component [Dimargaris cristalligena]|eukprot:RKP35979.1 dihydrolipoyllysine-residue succinyltransferase E2 component [Dimargaris cristalligena]